MQKDPYQRGWWWCSGGRHETRAWSRRFGSALSKAPIWHMHGTPRTLRRCHMARRGAHDGGRTPRRGRRLRRERRGPGRLRWPGIPRGGGPRGHRRGDRWLGRRRGRPRGRAAADMDSGQDGVVDRGCKLQREGAGCVSCYLECFPKRHVLAACAFKPS